MKDYIEIFNNIMECDIGSITVGYKGSPIPYPTLKVSHMSHTEYKFVVNFSSSFFGMLSRNICNKVDVNILKNGTPYELEGVLIESTNLLNDDYCIVRFVADGMKVDDRSGDNIKRWLKLREL